MPRSPAKAPPRWPLGAHLRAAIRRAGYPSIAAFARAAGIARVTASRHAHGHQQPPPATLRKIEHALGMGLAEIARLDPGEIPERPQKND